MPDQDPNAESAKRTLSEISHLFLSDVRDRHTGGAARPAARSPGQRPPAIPLDPVTPQRHGDGPLNESSASFVSAGEASSEPEVSPAPPVTAVVGAHLGGGPFVRVRQYARHLAGRIGRVGLIEIDGDHLRITCFEPASADPDSGLAGDDADGPESQVNDARALGEAVEELNWDVQQWLLAPANVRAPEIRSILGAVPHWALLSTCDHDGVVTSYRALKGLCEVVHDARPLLSLSLLDATSEPEIVRVFSKLSGVCRQFLDWPIQPEPAVRPAPDVIENPVLFFHPGQPAADEPSHWSVLADLVSRANSAGVRSEIPDGDFQKQIEADEVLSTPFAPPVNAAPQDPGASPARKDTVASNGKHKPVGPTLTYTPVSHAQSAPVVPASHVEDSVMHEQPRFTPQPAPAATITGTDGISYSTDSARPAPVEPTGSRGGACEVMEISAEGTAGSILAAMLARPDSGLVECPVRAPMCPSARLTIDRDRRVILLAVAREGLAELRSIGQAYRWLIENRALIGMAVPQFAIDAHQLPRLRLLIDQADASADILQPMLQSGHVTVQAYRRVRWGDRTGLLLDAA